MVNYEQRWIQQVAGNPRRGRFINETPQERERRLEIQRETALRRQRCQQKTEATASTNMFRGSNKILQLHCKRNRRREGTPTADRFQQNAVNRIRNESTDEERQRWKFTVKIIFFDTTIGSKNYTICKMHMRNLSNGLKTADQPFQGHPTRI